MMWLLLITVLPHAAPATAGQKPSRTDTLPDRRALIGLGVLFALMSVTLASALQYIVAGLFGIIFYATFPTMVALISLALGERLPRMFWLVLLGTTFGLALVLSPELLGGERVEGSTIGVGLTLLTAFMKACYILLSRRVLRNTKQVPRAVAWNLIGAFLAMAVIVVVIREVRIPDGRDIVFLLVLVISGTLLPRAALVLMASPFVTVVLAVLLLNEFLTAPQLIGGTLILASMIVLARASAPEEPPVQPQDVRLSTARP